ncbi:WbbJ Acetyltransferase isoleucine patch superfamily [Pyrenophora tritici-repentis]|uniref:Acetyltransferase n=2 Tax=Pyrenophora tritici-repentis TaxID=45151 RepID=A0A2W1EKK2_9PLEO|nr:acetyltransferase [Pyrenophora tritici-repentis Pt-1C-BFP]KAA8617888.1 Acetyltransferase [Pyrenophora tritici-repentis]EDU42744.1 acetyltransferase [Pyrenophora tritici-repentis Pt-1C-BFP]KAF7443157.1 Acetyltransferase [Pyrenophora tritici-repentis]KAF7568369.1 WbbJ, Acetyltransferase (isoleucine patch superfamily) [Pyrenophora tritici-repentis]KAG9377164.1 Acetyltransferase [Pyrenophora tritici-repentis]
MDVDPIENKKRMLCGELYYAFTPDLAAERERCRLACGRFNSADRHLGRRKLTELFRDIVQDKRPMPPEAPTAEEDDALFEHEPWILPPITMDYGRNVRVGDDAFINFGAVFLDTCLTTIGSRTLLGPNVHFYSATHPLDPALRNGIRGPEMGKEIHVGEDCWIGGNVCILPGVIIGKGSVVGAGSVVTKSVPDFTVVAGNPARFIRKIKTDMDPAQHQLT